MALTQDEKTAVQKQKRLSEIETQYLRGKEYVKSDKFIADQVSALAKLRKIVGTKGMLRDEALYAIGRVQQIIITLYDHEAAISEYEDIKRSLTEKFSPK